MHFTGLLSVAFVLTGTALGRVNNVPVDIRSLDQIYAATQGEDGKLVVVWGGDGEYYPPNKIEYLLKIGFSGRPRRCGSKCVASSLS